MKEKLKEVLAIQTYSYRDELMVAYILKQLDKIDCKYYIDDGNIHITKGDSFTYPCVVAHMDTVHRITDDLTVIELNRKLTGMNAVKMEQTGIGGDDKVGIFIALQCLEYFDNIKVVFFRDEEVGCDGSYNCDTRFFDNCDFILQCDRKGNGDFVTDACGVRLSSKKFQKDIKKIIRLYGYKFAFGMMTDVMALKELGISCSMANISCGYYNPHCDNEYVDIDDVMNCLHMVKDIIATMAGKYYPCDYVKPTYKKPEVYTDYKKSTWGDATYVPTAKEFDANVDKWYKEYYDKKDSKKEYCECCYEEAELEYVGLYNTHLCNKCIDNYVNYYDTPKEDSTTFSSDIKKQKRANEIKDEKLLYTYKGNKFYYDKETNMWRAVVEDNAKIIDNKTNPF